MMAGVDAQDGASKEDVVEVQERELQTESGEKREGFLGKVKDFIHDIGEKLEETFSFGKPTADVTGFHLTSITIERAEIVVDVSVHNPNPIPIPLVDINYLIESDGRKLVSGLIPDAGTIHPHGSETIKIPATLIYRDIRETYHDIKPGQIIPYKVKVDLIIDLPVLGNITIPLEKTGEIPVPYKPDVDVEKVVFEHLSLEKTSANLHLKVENKNEFDLGITALEYQFTLADMPVVNANLSRSATIGKCGEGMLEVPVSFRPKDFGGALWDMMRGRGAGYSMSGKLEVDTPFGPMHLPFSKEGGTTRLKKKQRGTADDESDED
eukprot:c20491_g1_i1 orf=410-1378(-)